MNESEIINSLNLKGFLLLGINKTGIVRAKRKPSLMKHFNYARFKEDKCPDCSTIRLIREHADPSICGECKNYNMSQISIKSGKPPRRKNA